MPIDYISSLESAMELCKGFEKRVLDVYFEGGSKEESNIDLFVWTPSYREFFKPVKACVRLCQILKLEPRLLTESMFFGTALDLEIPRVTNNLTTFKRHISIIANGFEKLKNEVSAICSAFNDQEKERINEAIHTYLEDCNYSCVAMSVSAVESRLLKLMCLASPESERELEKKTLGQLIYEYVDNKDNYKNIVPEKHEPLLQLCNVYRTFSVHPKKHKIKGPMASSILNLSIEFLTDQDTKLEAIKVLLAASEEAK